MHTIELEVKRRPDPASLLGSSRPSRSRRAHLKTVFFLRYPLHKPIESIDKFLDLMLIRCLIS